MKLLLTSTGLLAPKITAKFLAILPKLPAACSVLFIVYAQAPEENRYVEESKRELIDLGLKDITVFNLSAEKFETEKSFDIIYVCGGNTFDILNRMKKTGAFDFIKKLAVNEQAIYFGVSAGSIIAGRSIEIASAGSQGDPNNIELKDFSGLGLTNIAIYPHFTPEQQIDVDEFRKISADPIVALTDTEALLIDDDDSRAIKI